MNTSQIEDALDRIRSALEVGRLDEAIQALAHLRPADQAEAFTKLTDSDQATLLPHLTIRAAAGLLTELEDEEAADAAETFSSDRLADVLDEMPPDDAADIIGDLPPDRAAEVLASMEDAEDVFPLLGHPDESAGGLMTTSYIALRRHTTAAQAIDFLRQTEPSSATPYYLYVVDRDRKLIGVVGLRDLVVATPDVTMESIMKRDVIHATTHTDQEDVARLMTRYNLTALPVVDDAHVLQGVITHDDVIDVLEEETTKDLLQLGGVEPGPLLDRPYWSQRIPEIVRSRFIWLLGLFAAETLTGTVMRHFETQLQAVVSLSFFIPLLIGTGGNAGSQTVTTVIRGLALREIRTRDALRVVRRELITGSLLGLLLGSVAFGRVYLWGIRGGLAIVVAVTIFLICIWANAVGSLIPILGEAAGIDPTVMSAPLITTFVDATGLLIYFSMAILILQQI